MLIYLVSGFDGESSYFPLPAESGALAESVAAMWGKQ